MKTGWLLYDKCDYHANHGFVSYFQEVASLYELEMHLILTESLEEAIVHPPDFVVSRQRNHLLNRRFEEMGIPVFNNAKVCEICNDKRNMLEFLKEFPTMETTYLDLESISEPDDASYPMVVKPAFGHGGENVALVCSAAEFHEAVSAIAPEPVLVQKVADAAGKDLRVYVLFGKIIASVMRTASEGIVSNYKQGGQPSMHTLTAQEKELVENVMQHFSDQGAPLCFAGIDMIFHNGKPMINEVEDVVGSRMLYQVSKLDVIALYVAAIVKELGYDIIFNPLRD